MISKTEKKEFMITLEKFVILAGFIIVAFLGTPGFAVEFDDGQVHKIDHIQYCMDFVVLDRNVVNTPGTSLELTDGGDVGPLRAFNNSSIKINGGTASQGIRAYGNANITMNSGNIEQSLIIEDNVKISMSGGIVNAGIYLHNNAELRMSGGTIRGEIHINDDSKVSIFGGSTGSDLSLYGNGLVYAEGISTVNISAWDNSTLVLGKVSVESGIEAYENSTIYLEGSGFAAKDDSGNAVKLFDGDSLSDFSNRGTIYRILKDGSAFECRYGIFSTGTADIIVGAKPCDYSLSGDIDNDCAANQSDFAVITENWLSDGSTYSPEVAWSSQIGSINSDNAYSLALDDSGNVFMCGTFLAKYDPEGNLLWTEQLRANGDIAYAGAVDKNGNYFICGYTYGNLDGTNSGNKDAFVAKYNTSGSLQWTRQLGSANGDVCLAVATDQTGNIYITGYTEGVLGSSNAGGRDAFLAKYNSDGNLLCIEQLGTDSHDETKYVKAADNGNIFIAGFSKGIIDGTDATGPGVFIAEFDKDCNFLSAEQFPLAEGEFSWDFEIDSAANIYIAGYTRLKNEIDAIIAKYDQDGNLIWKEMLGKSSIDGSWAADEAWTVTLDDQENVFIGGYTYNDLDGINMGSHDVFAAKYDSEGNLKWIRQLGTVGPEKCYSIAADDSNNVYISGWTGRSFGGIFKGSFDAYLIKLSGYEPCGFFGDVDGSCIVDLADFAALAGNWMIDCNANSINSRCILK